MNKRGACDLFKFQAYLKNYRFFKNAAYIRVTTLGRIT